MTDRPTEIEAQYRRERLRNGRGQALNLILRGRGNSGKYHLVPWYGAVGDLYDGADNEREDGQHVGFGPTPGLCGRDAWLRDSYATMEYPLLVTWRKDDLPETCGHCRNELHRILTNSNLGEPWRQVLFALGLSEDEFYRLTRD